MTMDRDVHSAAEAFISSALCFPTFHPAVAGLQLASAQILQMPWNRLEELGALLKSKDAEKLATDLAIDSSRIRTQLLEKLPLYYIRWTRIAGASGAFLPTAAAVSIQSLDALMADNQLFTMVQKRSQNDFFEANLSDSMSALMSTEFVQDATIYGTLGMMRCTFPRDLFSRILQGQLPPSN